MILKKLGLFKSIQSFITAVLLILFGGLAGYYLGVEGYEVDIKRNVREIKIVNKKATLPDTVDFGRFWEIWNVISKEHISRPLDSNKLLDGAIHGMVSSIGDPYTTYLNTEQNAEVLDSLNGRYEGIGAQLGFNEDDRLIIVAPLDKSPAKRAGVRAGDMIVAIEGDSTLGISITEAVSKIRGNAKSVSHLTLFREGIEKPFDVDIVRETIILESVTWEDKGEGIVYIRLSRFGEDTNTEWKRVISEILTQVPNLDGIVLDVRNNPGGFLDSAVFIASEFISKGTIVSEDFADGTSHPFEVVYQGRLIDNDIPVAVLINGGSASASEIVAGALKERRSAILVGKRSFGKGSVQKAEEFSDKSALHVTVAKWITPNGNWVDKQNAKFEDSRYNERDGKGEEIIGGLKVDYEVNLAESDLSEGKDPQLDKAIELVKEKIRR